MTGLHVRAKFLEARTWVGSGVGPGVLGSGSSDTLLGSEVPRTLRRRLRDV